MGIIRIDMQILAQGLSEQNTIATTSPMTSSSKTETSAKMIVLPVLMIRFLSLNILM